LQSVVGTYREKILCIDVVEKKVCSAQAFV
jgi:hypothetical protein